ncbi:MAG: hypothetical protein ACE5H1_12520 [Thermodesulfobacteriota bacterium]
MLEKKEEKLEKEERKEFVEPELIKCEEPLDEVTMMPMYDQVGMTQID